VPDHNDIPPAPDLRRSPYTDSHGRNIGASADQIVTPGIFDTAQVEAVLEEDEDGMRDHLGKLLDEIQAESRQQIEDPQATDWQTFAHEYMKGVPAPPIEPCDPTLPPPFDWQSIAHAEPGEDTVESQQAQVPQHLEEPEGILTPQDVTRIQEASVVLFFGQTPLLGMKLWLIGCAWTGLFAGIGFVFGRV
jgi:hypothetical protein